MVIEGVIEGRKREIEGPFGEFTGHYSGGRNMTVIRIDRISYRTDPIFEHLYLGMPWTEIDYLMAANTCVPLYQQLKADFPEVQAVNAMYTHGLVVIVSTKKRYGGFAKAVGMRALTTPHGLGYAGHRDRGRRGRRPVQPAPGDVGAVHQDEPGRRPGRSSRTCPWSNSTPRAQPPGIIDKLIIDATTPVAPDDRGNYSNRCAICRRRRWLAKLQAARRPLNSHHTRPR